MDVPLEPFYAHLERECGNLPAGLKTFRARKGDVLFWHASLAHGGAPARDPHATRRSLAVHYSTPSGYPCDLFRRGASTRKVCLNGGYFFEWEAPGHVENRYPLSGQGLSTRAQELEAVARELAEQFKGPSR